jgi:ring-1,2-phenylacetyl-CoA epoxidase subunit PaaD
VILSKDNLIPLLPEEEMQRRQRRAQSEWPELWRLLDHVMDPEIPVISLYELGVLQDVRFESDVVVLTLTPTYIGCPALQIMEEDARKALTDAGYPDVRVVKTLSPAWTTAWLTSAAREKLQRYGVAAPLDGVAAATCPQCGSTDVEAVSEFGSTACKALFRCASCLEPFDLLKAI